MELVGTTVTTWSTRPATCSATGRMFLLLGSTTTFAEPVARTASTRSAVEGFIDWPPWTSVRTPSERKIRPTPSPTTTATTDVVGAGPSSSTSSTTLASRTQRSSMTCSLRSVTRISRGRPESMPASMAAPMSSVWMWQL